MVFGSVFGFTKCGWEIHCFGFGFVCQVPYVHLEAKLGEMVVYGLGSCLYVPSVLEDESAVVNIKEIIDVEEGTF